MINLNLIQEYIRLKKLDEAIKQLESYLGGTSASLHQNFTDHAECYYLLGSAYHIKGKLSHAIEAFSKALEINQSHIDASISLSIILNDIGKYDEAAGVFKKANSIIKSNNNAPLNNHMNKELSQKHEELGDLYFKFQKHEESLSEFQKAWNLNHEDIEVRLKIAKCFELTNQTARAIDMLHQLKMEFPDYMSARIQLGLLYYAQGNIIDAQIEWEKALTRDRNNKEIQMYLNMAKEATITKF